MYKLLRLVTPLVLILGWFILAPAQISAPAYNTIESSGSGLTRRQTLNFVFSAGAGSAVDNAGTGATDVSITGTTSGTVSTGVTLTSGLPVIGAGASAIAVGTRSGNTTAYANFTGALTGAAANVCTDGSGNLTTSGCPSSGSSVSIGATSALPACSVAGSTYFTTDGFYTYVCDGSVNQPFMNGWNLIQPLSGTFAAAGSGSDSPTIVTSHGGIIFSSSGGSASFNYRVKSLANSAPYTVLIGIMNPAMQSANSVTGIALRESSTGKTVILGYRGFSDPVLLAGTDSSVSSVLCSTGTSAFNGPVNAIRFLKLTVTGGGTITPSISADPYGYVINTTCATTVAGNFTSAPNQFGLALESNTAASGISTTWVHFQELSGIH
jgi:hypothetical protein